jgi:DNA-binding beta-propeller fold protein YncE
MTAWLCLRTFSRRRRVRRAILLIAIVLALSVGAPTPARAVLNSAENATDILGQFSAVNTDTTDVFTTGCLFNGASQIGFNDPTYAVIDSTYHRLFVSDSGNNRVLVFTLNTNNTLSSKTAANVLGQPNFKSCYPNGGTFYGGATTQSYTYNPEGLAFDSTHNLLYVADSYNNRVLVFNTATITNGMNASYVLGQPGFTTGGGNQAGSGSPVAGDMYNPVGLAYDGSTYLYVADNANSRVLIFNTSTLSNGKNASYEFGQPSGGTAFTTSTPATSQSGMSYPEGLAYDSTNSRLYVSDSNNNRVLEFSTSSLSNGKNASFELGQPSGGTAFTTYATATSQSGMAYPQGLAYDSTNSRLFVGDAGNNRILVFSTSSLSNGENASNVLCQPNFTSSINSGGGYGYGPAPASCFEGGSAYDATNNLLSNGDYQYNQVEIFNVAPTQPTTSSPAQSGGDGCAIASGQLYCWGANWYGEDGTGNYLNYLTPAQVGTATNWTVVSTGGLGVGADTCGIAGGALYCWGWNADGEDGLGNTTYYSTPQQVGTDTTWTVISQSGTDACGIDNGKLYCWGYNGTGEDGLGNTTQYTTPQQVGALTNWTAVSTGGNNTCGIAGGKLYCWGENQDGAAGLGISGGYDLVFVTTGTYNGDFGTTAANAITAANNDCTTAASAAGLQGTFQAWIASIANGSGGANDPVTTFVDQTGNSYEEVNGTVVASNWTGLISGTLTNKINIGPSGTTVTGDAWTNVGTNGVAEHNGSSTADNCAAWTTASGSDHGYYGLLSSATSTWTYGSSNTATCSTAEHLYCFQQYGSNDTWYDTPQQVGTLTNWTAVSTSSNTTCGIAGGQLYCWGYGGLDQLGLGNTNNYDTPQAVGASISTTGWTAVATGDGNQTADTCAIASGKLYCWGYNGYGTAGQGNTTQYTTPQQVGAATNWTAISFGNNDPDVCGIAGGQLYCWGQNWAGEDGVGTNSENTTPQAVSVDSIGNGMTATDLLGHYNSLTSTATVTWTDIWQNNGPTALGFGSTGGIALDPVHHNLFVADPNPNRVLVYALNTDNSIPTTSGGHTASYVLGASDFMGDCNSSCSGIGPPGGMAVDTVDNLLYVAAGCWIPIFNTASISNGMAPTYYLGGSCGTSQSLFQGGVNYQVTYDVAFDAVNNRLFVTDTADNRVLVFNTSTITNGMNASYELGQPSGGTAFTASSANGGASGPTQSGMYDPENLAFDPANQRLFVSDTGNNRILVFNVAPSVISNGENASYELGQPSGSTAFTTNACFGGYCPTSTATTASGLAYPAGLSYDANNNRLFVSDNTNCRVLVFNAGPSVIANGENASFEVGQSSFTSGGCQGGSQAANYIYSGTPYVYYDAGSGRLFVSTGNDARVLIFEAGAISTPMQSFFSQQF